MFLICIFRPKNIFSWTTAKQQRTYIIIIIMHVPWVSRKNDLWKSIQRVKVSKKYFLIAIMVYKVASHGIRVFFGGIWCFFVKTIEAYHLITQKTKAISNRSVPQHCMFCPNPSSLERNHMELENPILPKLSIISSFFELSKMLHAKLKCRYFQARPMRIKRKWLFAWEKMRKAK